MVLRENINTVDGREIAEKRKARKRKDKMVSQMVSVVVKGPFKQAYQIRPNPSRRNDGINHPTRVACLPYRTETCDWLEVFVGV